METNMSKEEALVIIKRRLTVPADDKSFEKYSMAYAIAESDIGQTIPVHLIYTADKYNDDGVLAYDTARCPACQRIFKDGTDTWQAHFCPNCGAPLNWDDLEGLPRLKLDKQNDDKKHRRQGIFKWFSFQ